MAGFVVRDTVTGSYLTTSQAAGVDHTDIGFARVYGRESTAKGVATYYQSLYDSWHETRTTLAARYPQSEYAQDVDKFKRAFVVER